MCRRFVACMLVVGTVLLHASQADADIIQTQTFDTAPAWTGFGNVNGATGNNFGFSVSNNTQGTSPAGEAGGTIARTAQVSYYADTNLGGTLDFNRSFQASGEFVLNSTSNFNNGIFIGYRDTSAGSLGSQFMNFAGFMVAEPQGFPTYRFIAYAARADGALLGGTELGIVQTGVPYTWTFRYDPSIGSGRLQAELFDSHGSLGVSTQDLSASDRAIGATFNAFGIGSGGLGQASSTNVANVFIDNVAYSTAAVPEPSSFVLCGLAAGCVAVWRKRRSANAGASA